MNLPIQVLYLRCNAQAEEVETESVEAEHHPRHVFAIIHICGLRIEDLKTKNLIVLLVCLLNVVIKLVLICLLQAGNSLIQEGIGHCHYLVEDL